MDSSFWVLKQGIIKVKYWNKNQWFFILLLFIECFFLLEAWWKAVGEKRASFRGAKELCSAVPFEMANQYFFEYAVKFINYISPNAWIPNRHKFPAIFQSHLLKQSDKIPNAFETANSSTDIQGQAVWY